MPLGFLAKINADRYYSINHIVLPDPVISQ